MAIYTRIQASDLNKIVAPYQIEVIDFTPIEGGNANSNYHIHAKNGEYIMTIAEEKSFHEVQKLTTLLQWLGKHHFLTSQVHATITGETVTQHAGKPVFVKKWLYGRVHENLTTDELGQIGTSMAQLHQIPAPDYLPKYHPYGQQAFSSVIGKGIDTEYEKWLKERFQFLKKHVPEGLPLGLVHGDIFFDNVLFENNKIKAIIDFEEACNYYLIFDLGMGILGLCRTGEKIDLNKARSLIKGYEQIRFLGFPERDSLQLFIEYAAIATSWWRFWKYNIHTPTPDLRNKHWKMVQVAKEVEILDKKHFLSIVFE